MKNSQVPHAISAHVLATRKNRGKKRKPNPQSNWKGKTNTGASGIWSKTKPNSNIPAVSDPKEATFYYCNEKGIRNEVVLNTCMI